MSRKMQVLFIKQTGHVMAAFTRAADPEGKLKVEDLVGTALPVRNRYVVSSTPATEPLFVPPTSLDLAIVELEEEAFVTPRAFIVSGTKLEVIGGSPPNSPSLSTEKIIISRSTPVAEDTKVWAQVQQINPSAGEEPIRRVVEGVIMIDANNTTPGSAALVLRSLPDQPPAPIPTGDYEIVVLVAGMAPLFTKKTVT